MGRNYPLISKLALSGEIALNLGNIEVAIRVINLMAALQLRDPTPLLNFKLYLLRIKFAIIMKHLPFALKLALSLYKKYFKINFEHSWLPYRC